jgi:acyl carrier protein
MALADRVAALFEKVFGIEPGEFKPEMVPEDVLRWDSLGHMTLMMDLEDTFGVHFEVDEIAEMSSGQKILDILKAKGVKDE